MPQSLPNGSGSYVLVCIWPTTNPGAPGTANQVINNCTSAGGNPSWIHLGNAPSAGTTDTDFLAGMPQGSLAYETKSGAGDIYGTFIGNHSGQGVFSNLHTDFLTATSGAVSGLTIENSALDMNNVYGGSPLGNMALQTAENVVITGGSITGTDLNATVDGIDGGGGGTGGSVFLPDLAPGDAALIGASILGLWALAWVFRQFQKQVQES